MTASDPAPLRLAIPVTSLPAGGRDVSITATADECAAIAADFGLLGCTALTASFTITKAGGPLIAVQGQIDADVEQECCVSLKPVTNHVRADVALTFTLSPDRAASEVEIDPDDVDPPEPVENGEIDIGALACEHLALNIDPYPRSPGAAFSDQLTIEDAEPAAPNTPFAALAALKKGENSG